MTKREACELLGCKYAADLAYLLRIKPSAVYQWGNKQIPLAREYQVRDLLAGKDPIQREPKKAA